MEKKITIEENQTIEINGAVLTPEVIKVINNFQENENEVLKRVIRDLAETVCFLTIEAFDYSGLDKKNQRKKTNGLITRYFLLQGMVERFAETRINNRSIIYC